MNAILNIKQKLKSISDYRNRCKALITFFLFTDLTLLFLLSLNYGSNFFFIKEKSAFYLLITSLIFFTICLFSVFLIAYQKIKSYSSISEEIEAKSNIYKDALNTVANFIDGSKQEFSPIETVLAIQTQSQLTANYNKSVLQPKNFNRNIFVLTSLCVILIISILLKPVIFEMAYYGYIDSLNHSNTYFKIEPGNLQTKTGSTIKITAQLMRERNIGKPVFLHLKEANNKKEDIFMRHLGNNLYEANIYDIQTPFSYFVTNEMSTSEIFNISTFELPNITTKEMLIEPPAYTGLTVQKLEEFDYVTVPENSRIQIKIVPNKISKVFYKSKNKNELFSFNEKTSHLYVFRVKEYTEYNIHLIDQENREYETNPIWVIETIPDLPPTADIKEPAGDKKMYGIEDLDISFMLTDDYGLSKAQLVFQTPREGIIEMNLSLADVKKEKGAILEDKVTIELNNLSLQNGDLVSYYIKVWDNKSPTNQVSTSNVKFINIIPGKMSKKDEEPSEQQGQTARIDDIIAELKRIYRATIPLQYEKNKDTLDNQSVEQANALSDLKNNTNQRFKKLKFLPEGNIINDLFKPKDNQYLGKTDESSLNDTMEFIQTISKNIIKDIENAEYAMRNTALAPALQSETEALQKLNQLSQLLSQLMQPSESESQSQDSSESDPNKKQQNKEKQKKPQSLDEKKKKIQQLIDKLEDANEKNQTANQQLSKSGESLSEEDKKHFSDKKREIKSDMQSASDEMQTDQDLFPVQDQLIKAIREATNEESNLAKGQKQNAMKHGVKTDFFLKQSIDQLKSMKNKLDQSAIQNAQNTVDEILQKQNDLKNKTQNENDPKKQAELSKAQEELKNSIKDLENKIKSAIQETEANSPEASAQLEEGLNQLNQNNVDQKMGKASKSIFYGLKDKAKQEQVSVIKALNETKDKIDSAQQKMGEPGKQQLLKALSKLNQLKENKAETSDPKKAEDLKNTLDEIGGKNTPQFLKDTEKLAEQLQNAKAGEQVGITADQLILEAMTLIEKKLKEMEISDQLRKKMHQQLPPDQYRKMVEEYFQNLSRKNQ